MLNFDLTRKNIYSILLYLKKIFQFKIEVQRIYFSIFEIKFIGLSVY